MIKRLEIFETKRTFLRPFLSEDAEDLYELNNDPVVIRYTGDLPFQSVAEARYFIRSYQHYTHFGYGRWAVIRKKDYAFLGWCGLKYYESSSETDLGFRFKRKFWNQGYATETAKASLIIGFEAYELSEIIGRSAEENLASIRVMEKIGMAFSHLTELAGMSAKQYIILKSGGSPTLLPESAVFSNLH